MWLLMFRTLNVMHPATCYDVWPPSWLPFRATGTHQGADSSADQAPHRSKKLTERGNSPAAALHAIPTRDSRPIAPI